MVRGRCRSTNLCAYCARLAAVENSEVLAIDAMTTGGPQLYAVLTTRSAMRDPRHFYRAREAVQRALRRRWPECQYAALVEFTTGRAGTSGGIRRPHWNLLLKGIPDGDLDAARDVIRAVWCQRVDATPANQYVGHIQEAGGLMRYLALHFQKEAQAPPAGWRGHRFMHSRGYFPQGVVTMRALAQDNLKLRRVVWRIGNAACDQDVWLEADEVHELALRAHAESEAHSWKLHRLYELARVSPAHRSASPRIARRGDGAADT